MWRRPAVATCLLLTAGCFSYHCEPGQMRGSERVRVRFATPHSVDVVVEGRDTINVPAVSRLEGVILAARGDTLTLDVRHVRTRTRRVQEIAGRRAIAVVRLAPGTAIEVRRVDRLETAFAVVVIPPLVAIAFFLYWVSHFHGDT